MKKGVIIATRNTNSYSTMFNISTSALRNDTSGYVKNARRTSGKIGVYLSKIGSGKINVYS